MTVSLLLGAGFSKWAADLPVAQELFDFAIKPFGPVEARKLQRVASLKQDWDGKHRGAYTEQFVADALSFHEEHREIVLWYITRRLSEPFVWIEWHAGRYRRHVLQIDENRKFQIEGVRKAQRFIAAYQAPSLVGIVTTNYDLITEYALGTRGFNYGKIGERLIGRGPYPVSTWRNPVVLRGTAPLAKLHGSLSWDDSAHYTEGRRGLTGRALIVAPGPEKRPPEQLWDVWDLANKIFLRTEHLVVFGFSFNPYDQAVLNLLSSSGQKIESVTLIDVVPRVDEARQIWSNAIVTATKPAALVHK